MHGVGYRINMLHFNMLKFLKVDFCYLKQVNLIRNLFIQIKPIFLLFLLPWKKILRS